jgi:flagellar basal-body rod protein FlgB
MAELFSNVTALHRSLDYHSERHNVIASNIANANTPGFRPLELMRVESGETGGTLPLARSQEAHLATLGSMSLQAATVERDRSHSGGLDDNTVSLEREMSKLSANDVRYQGSARMVAHKLGMLRYAANDASGG